MKGKKATREQRKFLEQFKIDTYNVLILKDSRHHNGKMLILNTKTGEKKEICKAE